MMRMILAAGVMLVGLGVTASAADLPPDVTEPNVEPTPTIPLFSWTGYYVGLQAGYGSGRDRAVRVAPATGPSVFGYNPRGVVGGAHFGYNYALPTIGDGNTVVLGTEGDIDGADYQRTASPFGGLMSTSTVALQSDIKGSLRARLGFGVNRSLFYATGGAAFADFDTRYNATPVFGAGAFDANDHVRIGYTIGGGVEYAFMNYVTVRAEYRYTDYGSFVDTLASSAPGLGMSVTHRESDNRLQAAISYKFDSIVPAPAAQ